MTSIIAKTAKKDYLLNLKDISIPNPEPVIKVYISLYQVSILNHHKELNKTFDENEIKKIKSKQKRKIDIAFCDLNQTIEEGVQSKEKEKDSTKDIIPYSRKILL